MTFFVFLAFLALTLSRGFCVLSSLLLALSSMLFVNQTNLPREIYDSNSEAYFTGAKQTKQTKK
jgi:hypothetical protein